MIAGANLYAGGGVRHVETVDWMAAIEGLAAKAVIFDCDGTLVQSADAHFQAMRTAAAAQGYVLQPNWYRQRTGLDRATLFTQFQAGVAASLDIGMAIRDSMRAFPCYAPLIQPVPETLALVAQLRARGFPLAIGTNAERSIAQVSLSAVGLWDFIPVVVCISDDVLPKPNPAIFLEAARRLGAAPEQCLVVEDSEQGLSAALSAGMCALMIKPIHEAGAENLTC